MWIIAGLLLVTFIWFLLGRIVRTRRTFSVYFWLGMAAWGIAAYLSPHDDYVHNAVVGLPLLFIAVSDVIAGPVWRRRVIPPCVRAKRPESMAGKVFVGIVGIGIIISMISDSLHSLSNMLLAGPLTAAMIIWVVLALFEKIEICANGILVASRLRPWDEFESFAWERKGNERVELRLRRKSSVWRWIRLVVPPEDREAAQQILEAHLVDTSMAKMEA
jgi:hypothetical protein